MSLIDDLQGLLLLIAGSFAAVGAVFYAGRRAGRKREKTDRLKDELEESEANNEILRKQTEAAADRPRDRDDLSERMRDGSF